MCASSYWKECMRWRAQAATAKWKPSDSLQSSELKVKSSKWFLQHQWNSIWFDKNIFRWCNILPITGADIMRSSAQHTHTHIHYTTAAQVWRNKFETTCRTYACVSESFSEMNFPFRIQDGIKASEWSWMKKKKERKKNKIVHHTRCAQHWWKYEIVRGIEYDFVFYGLVSFTHKWHEKTRHTIT